MGKKTRMLAFDSSSTITGVAYFENGKLVKSFVIDKSREKDTLIRVEGMCIALAQTLKKFTPDIVVIERPPYCNSPDTLIMLSEIVGCVKGWAICNYADYVEYAVNSWRKLVAKEGETIPTKRNEAKAWDMARCKAIYNVVPADDNEADAILIGHARIKEFEKCA